MVEEHGGGRQLLRIRTWPRMITTALFLSLMFALLSAGALWDGALAVAIALGAGSIIPAAYAFADCAIATASLAAGIKAMDVNISTEETSADTKRVQVGAVEA